MGVIYSSLIRTVIVSAVLLLAWPGRAQTLRRDATVAPELVALSGQLARFQRVLDRDFGFGEILVGGGSSRAILDSLYFGKPFKARDVDVFLVADRKVTRALAGGVARALQASRPGELQLKDLEIRWRALPSRRPQHNAGWGFFLKRPNGEVFDLSLFHSAGDLGLNGCLNVDRIMLPLARGETLLDVVDRMRGQPYQKLVSSGHIRDPHSGYRGWQENRLEVVNPAELTSRPVLWSVRLARSFGKAGYDQLPSSVVKLLREGLARPGAPDNVKMVERNLKRLLQDGRAEAELKMALAPGVLQRQPCLRKLMGKPRTWTVARLQSWAGIPALDVRASRCGGHEVALIKK